MKKNILVRTNIFVCAIIIIGFIITFFVSYRSNIGVYERDVEKVATLTSEGIYYQIESIFTKPLNISLSMANDTLLKKALEEEDQFLENEDYTNKIVEYLNAYREKFDYNSTFLVSARTGRYYHFNGLNRILKEGNPENDWYYEMLESGEDYSLNVDNDEAAADELTVFINCRIKGENGETLGIVGVGFDIKTMQELLLDYEKRFELKTSLINEKGIIEVATDKTGYENVDLFSVCGYPDLKDQILNGRDKVKYLWHDGDNGKMYVGARYLSSLDWFLLVEKDTSEMSRILNRQLQNGIFIVLLIVSMVITVITRIIWKYNKKILDMAREAEEERRTIFQLATEQLFENIFEVDITNNCAANGDTERYFESLGAPKNMPFDQVVRYIANKRVKEEFREGYIRTLDPENIRKAFDEGRESLQYEFLITVDGVNYYWNKVVARMVKSGDGNLHVLFYRQNIDEQKQQETRMMEQIQRDSMTGLYDKVSTERRIQEQLEKDPGGIYAFFIVDIDDFKHVNDEFGHAIGDRVILQFAGNLTEMFGNEGTIGRIGGDEFVAFIKLGQTGEAEKKAERLSAALQMELACDHGMIMVSASIGVAVSPKGGRDFGILYQHADTALYEAKQQGKNGYCIYKARE